MEGFNGRLEEAEDQITELEDKVEKNNNTQVEQQLEKIKKEEQSLRELWDNMKQNKNKKSV